MASKPETTFTGSIERHLPQKLYREKMFNSYRGGTFDKWYSGKISDLWVEYKFITLPKRDATLIYPDLSGLQLKWGLDRHKEGRNVWVIVGCKEGGVILQSHEWDTPIRCDEFRSRLMKRSELANWIVEQTGGICDP